MSIHRGYLNMHNLPRLCNFYDLFSVYVYISDSTVLSVLLQAGSSDSIYRYITASLQSFPLVFHPVLTMMSSLAQSSRKCAAFVSI